MDVDQKEVVQTIVGSEGVGLSPSSPPAVLRARLLSGSAVMLLSSGMVGALNLVYNIAIARALGAAQFGHATAVYTLLMLLSSVTLAFQLVCSKFVAKNTEVPAKVAVYKNLHQLSWQIGLAIGLGIVLASRSITDYLNLPERTYVLLLGIGAATYIPLGTRRGLMQGACNFRRLAANFVLEVCVKLGGALLLLEMGFGVTGVIGAVVASIAIAYLAARPGAVFRVAPQAGLPSSFHEGMQAIVFFVGQVTINNIDIVLVKHFFPAALAGLYAAVALVGRVVYMLSWSVVSSMFPVSASSEHERSGRTVLSTALLLVVLVACSFTIAAWLAPSHWWSWLLGSGFEVQAQGSFSGLVVLYAVVTGIYSFSVAIMAYEISRRLGNVSWLQLGFSGAIVLGIYLFHSTLHEVITVQLVTMILLLVVVSVTFLRAKPSAGATEVPLASSAVTRLRRVEEDEVIAEFLRAEFYHPEFDPYRPEFEALVMHPNFSSERENAARRALLFRRRGRMWRELPEDTQWWLIDLREDDLARIRVFPRKQWRRLANGSFYLNDMIDRIRDRVQSEQAGRFAEKIRCVVAGLEKDGVPDAVLLIASDETSPMTIIEGNHRMAAASLAYPDVHRRFRFYCGFSPNMAQCCWYKTDFLTLWRYGGHVLRYVFHDTDYFLQRALKGESSAANLPSQS
jgi:O-antigen/teichoic acid export membrane protein